MSLPFEEQEGLFRRLPIDLAASLVENLPNATVLMSVIVVTVNRLVWRPRTPWRRRGSRWRIDSKVGSLASERRHRGVRQSGLLVNSRAVCFDASMSKGPLRPMLHEGHCFPLETSAASYGSSTAPA